MGKELHTLTDEELYDKLSEGKTVAREAFELLYSRYANRIYTYCRKIMGDERQAEDLFQETFARFYEASTKEKKMTHVAGYLIRIARNLCLNEKQKKVNQGVPLEEFRLIYNDQTINKMEMGEILNMGLDALPENYKEVIVLKEVMGFSYQEIADTLGVSLPLIRIRIHRAKARLREILQPYFEEYEK